MTARRDDIGRSIREDGIVCCTIGDEQYALRSGDVRYITRAEQMRREPGPNGRVGTIHVADETVPVFPLGRVLERPGPAGAGHHIAVTGDRGALVGWLVDRVVRMSLTDSTNVVALPAIVGMPATAWFEAAIAVDDDSVLLLSAALLGRSSGVVERADPGEVFVTIIPPAAPVAEPMVVMFSTPALPLAPETPSVDPSRVTRYALSGRQIAAIVQPLPIVRIPGSAPHVVGVSWWRQVLVPVVDFRGGAGEHAPCPRWIVAQTGHRPAENLIAIPIDSDVRLHRASADDRHVASAIAPFTRGVYDVNGEDVALLDLDALTSPLEERVPA